MIRDLTDCKTGFDRLSNLFYRDADDTKAWISEKDTALSTTDYGRDLASVQALQRKHDVLERDLAALEEKVCIAHAFAL